MSASSVVVFGLSIALIVTGSVDSVRASISPPDNVPAASELMGEEFTVEPFTPFTPPDPRNLMLDFTDAEISYHAVLAKERGVSVAEVAAEQVQILRLSAVAAQIEVSFPGLLIQSEWRQDASPNAQLVLSAPIPPEAMKVIEAAPLSIDVVDFSGPTVDESNAVIEAVIDLLRSEGSTEGISGGFDLTTRTYSFSYSGAELNGSAAAEVERLTSGLDVSFFRTESPAEPEYGGGYVLGLCTSGFVVRNGGTHGIATAAHCSGLSGSYSYQDGYFSNGGTLNPSYGDVRWGWGSSGTPTTLFRGTSTQTSAVTDVVTPTVGMGHCKFGIATNTTCNTVAFTNRCADYPSDTQGTMCRLYCDQSYHTDKGDSGGPVFGGSTALGLHSGRVSVNGVDRSCFSGATNLYTGAYVDINR